MCYLVGDRREGHRPVRRPGLAHPLTGARFLATATGGRDVYALRHGQTTVATGSLSFPDRGTARIGRVLADPARRGQGLGRAIVELLIDHAVAHPDVHATTLGVYEHNHSARRLYASLGFLETGERTSTQVTNDTWSSLELRRPLTTDPR